MITAVFRKTFLLVPLLVAALALPLVGFSSGPLDSRTGAPGEGSCQDCHGTNSGNGNLQLYGVPVNYELGATYTLAVTLEDPTQDRWGFEMTAVDAGGDGAGSFTIIDALNTQLSDNAAPARDYPKHTSTGTRAGTAAGPVTWGLQWTAPASDVGTVTLYVAGNAANNNGSSSGDNIYFTSAASDPPEPVVTQPCGDVNCDETANISDAVYLIQYIFNSGPAPCEACP